MDTTRRTTEETEDIIKEIVKNIIQEDEDEVISITKHVLLDYLDTVIENPENLIKELIESKDKKIKELEERVRSLELIKSSENYSKSNMMFRDLDYCDNEDLNYYTTSTSTTSSNILSNNYTKARI